MPRKLSWRRWSEWDGFPDDSRQSHRGADQGPPRGKPGTDPEGVRPTWPWSQDQTELGTADFRSIKYCVYEAAMVAPSGAGLRVRTPPIGTSAPVSAPIRSCCTSSPDARWGKCQWLPIVAYLADDARRGAAFEALRKQVGLTPRQFLTAPKEVLCEITRMGGSIAAEERAERLQMAAQLTLDQFAGDLDSILKLPPQKAKKLLMQFPMTGEPGAEKILMFAGALGVLALESNGLRVLVRLGFARSARATPRLTSRFARSHWRSCRRTANC